jgi:hypothetical protein
MQINLDYTPVPAAKLFHASPARVKLAVGGKRSSKTRTMTMDGVMLSFEFPGNIGLLARETYGETQDAIIDPLMSILPREVIASEPTNLHKSLQFTNGSRIYFRGLDEHRKSKGLTLGWAGIDEVDAVTEEDLIQLDGQISLKDVRPVLMATTNPVGRDHWVYRRFVTDELPGYSYYRFPTMDNAINLPDGYVEHMLQTMPESWVKRYLKGEWGTIVLGERVWPEYSEKLHLYPELFYSPKVPVIRTWDFGNRMAVTFSQMRDQHGIDFLSEILKKHLTATQFAQGVARFSQENFPGATFDDYGDIAGLHTESTSGMSPIDVVQKELGIHINYSQMPLKDSLDLVSEMLSKNVQGSMAVRFSPKMRLTTEGLNGGYVWQKNRDGTVKKGVPAADDTFEHLMDDVRMTLWHKFAYGRAGMSGMVELPQTDPYWDDTSW